MSQSSLPPGVPAPAPMCRRCDRVILGESIRIEMPSASGGRPDAWEHPPGAPDCQPVRLPPSTLRRRLRR